MLRYEQYPIIYQKILRKQKLWKLWKLFFLHSWACLTFRNGANWGNVVCSSSNNWLCGNVLSGFLYNHHIDLISVPRRFNKTPNSEIKLNKNLNFFEDLEENHDHCSTWARRSLGYKIGRKKRISLNQYFSIFDSFFF